MKLHTLSGENQTVSLTLKSMIMIPMKSQAVNYVEKAVNITNVLNRFIVSMDILYTEHVRVPPCIPGYRLRGPQPQDVSASLTAPKCIQHSAARP